MKLRSYLAAGAAAVAMSIAVASPAGATGTKPAPAPEPAPTATLADILEAQGGATDRNWYDYDILAAGVQAAGLTAALDDPNADLTVFIPNDRAFQALVVDLFGWEYFLADEAKVLNKLVELETSAPGTLKTVITYHAIGGQVDSKAALSVPRGTELTTLQGGTIKVFPIRWLGTAFLIDQDTNDFDPWLVPGQLDIKASNGIAHGIALVLRPADL